MELVCHILSTGKPSEVTLLQWQIPPSQSKIFAGAYGLWRDFTPVGAFRRQRQGAAAAACVGRLVRISLSLRLSMAAFCSRCPEPGSGYLLNWRWLSETCLANLRMSQSLWRVQGNPRRSSWSSHTVTRMALPLNHGCIMSNSICQPSACWMRELIIIFQERLKKKKQQLKKPWENLLKQGGEEISKMRSSG